MSALVKSVDAVPGGAFVIYNIPNYGETQPFWSPDGTVQGIETRRKTESLYQARLLVLDDIGAQTGKQEWIDNALFRLIDYRKREFLPTIFTSNCDSEQLKMDDRSVDRIVSISTEVKIPERSIRREKAAEANRKFIQGLLDAEKP